MDPLQQRVNEKKIYEEVVNIIVDYVAHEFGDDEEARLRVYAKIAENFEGMVRALKPPESSNPPRTGIIEYGEEPDAVK